jgi:hypothetical protein
MLDEAFAGSRISHNNKQKNVLLLGVYGYLMYVWQYTAAIFLLTFLVRDGK